MDINKDDKREEILTVPYENRNYPKSNMLIGAKYRSSLFENKIMAISLSKIQECIVEKETGLLVSVLKASEIKELIGTESTSIYRDLNEVARRMTGRNIGITDSKSEFFDYIAVVIRATYENGELRIKYNPDIKEYILDIKNNFTLLPANITLSFKSVYSFRLYELLKSRCFYPKGVTGNNQFKIYYSLSEFKLLLGVVNAELDEVRKILAKSKHPDYDKAVEASPEKMFKTWSDFKKRVLDVAVNEINETADLHIEYDLNKQGKGGKVKGITFIVELLNNKDNDIVNDERQKEPLTESEKDDFIDWLSEIIEPAIKLRDLRTIAEEAKYDKETILIANSILSKQKEVSNVTGFLISAIRNQYSEAQSYKPKSQKIHGFEQHDYDFEKLEKELLVN